MSGCPPRQLPEHSQDEFAMASRRRQVVAGIQKSADWSHSGVFPHRGSREAASGKCGYLPKTQIEVRISPRFSSSQTQRLLSLRWWVTQSQFSQIISNSTQDRPVLEVRGASADRLWSICVPE